MRISHESLDLDDIISDLNEGNPQISNTNLSITQTNQSFQKNLHIPGLERDDYSASVKTNQNYGMQDGVFLAAQESTTVS